MTTEVQKLESMIVQAAGYLEVPQAFGNRVQDFQLWLDSPPTGNDMIGRLNVKIEQLEEEARTIAAYAADLEHKLRRIEARAMNGWACAQIANEECEAIAQIIKGEDDAELEFVMQAVAQSGNRVMTMASESVTVTVISPEQRKAMADTLRATAKAIEDQSLLHQSGGMVVGPCNGGLGIKSDLVLSFATKH